MCDVRRPTAFAGAEQGATGFLGKKVQLDDDEALRRRVESRLGSAIRDNATVLLAVDGDAEGEPVVGTVDCVPLAAGRGRRAFDSPLPPRALVRNLWVSPDRRRQGVGGSLMREAEEWARNTALDALVLDVAATNEGALALYLGLGFVEVDAAPPFVPRWARGALSLVKTL